MTNNNSSNNPDKITKAMLSEWCRHPVTVGMLDIIRDILEGNKEHLDGLIMNGKISEQAEILAQLKGQILALKEVLKTKEFLSELIEDEVKQ